MRVLHIEDSLLLSETFEAALHEFDPAVVFQWAGKGRTALELLHAENTYDIIVCDLGLPGMDGPELIQKIRETAQNTPIAVLSGITNQSTRETATQAGANICINKMDAIEAVAIALYRTAGKAIPAALQQSVPRAQKPAVYPPLKALLEYAAQGKPAPEADEPAPITLNPPSP